MKSNISNLNNGEVLYNPKKTARLRVQLGRSHASRLIDLLIYFVRPGNYVYANSEFLAEQLGLSVATIKKHINTLVSHGFMRVLDSHKAKYWLSTEYVIQPEMYTKRSYIHK